VLVLAAGFPAAAAAVPHATHALHALAVFAAMLMALGLLFLLGFGLGGLRLLRVLSECCGPYCQCAARSYSDENIANGLHLMLLLGWKAGKSLLTPYDYGLTRFTARFCYWMLRHARRL
jgi:hypothetical protein